MVDNLTLDTIAPLVGQTFRLRLDDGAVIEMALDSATSAPQVEAANDNSPAVPMAATGTNSTTAPQ